ncbi:MAG: hypothetical protein ABIA63_09175 [bacterium]
MSKKRKKAQDLIITEVKNQLLLQAERWGRKDYYTPLKLEEIELEQCNKIVGEFLAEKSNLEYELHMLESDKKDVLAKMERLQIYLAKSARVAKKHENNIGKIIQQKIGDREKINAAVNKVDKKSAISVLISDN